MPQKPKRFNAYQIDLHYLDTSTRNQTDAIMWDAAIVSELWAEIFTLAVEQRTRRYNDSWLMYLDYFEEDEHYIFGRFLSAEYGTTGELLHADQLTLRPNPKLVREGETEATYFLIKKVDGLLLLQSNIRLNRPRFEEYIETLGAEVIRRRNLTFIQICTLLENNFFESIRQLNTVHKIEIEVSKTEIAADENEAVRALQNDVEEISATDVKLEFEAKYQRSGLKGVLPLVKKYKDQQGVTKIVVRGKLAGAEKVIKLDDSQEQYRRRVEVDTNNQPMLTSVENVLKEVANQRRKLRE
ncbi:hypothetical protein OIN60_08860 [Paenibacillus sp. P96]|uniref:DUF4747 family protein n=1 Tax=Paenibacillus zeirhizosphaerae TaxID=2987519 RepID=A0ABT9FQ78_9BACL|nr:hypothetical protein [Paenibacillus sp. P96]MDP4096880.1 hypothetical protein [Paenibacillus sp. P96]